LREEERREASGGKPRKRPAGERQPLKDWFPIKPKKYRVNDCLQGGGSFRDTAGMDPQLRIWTENIGVEIETAETTRSAQPRRQVRRVDWMRGWGIVFF
jgi:hypothetical protein